MVTVLLGIIMIINFCGIILKLNLSIVWTILLSVMLFNSRVFSCCMVYTAVCCNFSRSWVLKAMASKLFFLQWCYLAIYMFLKFQTLLEHVYRKFYVKDISCLSLIHHFYQILVYFSEIRYPFPWLSQFLFLLRKHNLGLQEIMQFPCMMLSLTISLAISLAISSCWLNNECMSI